MESHRMSVRKKICMVGYLSDPTTLPPMYNGALSLVKSGYDVEALCVTHDSALPSREVLTEGFEVRRLYSLSLKFFHRLYGLSPDNMVRAAAQYITTYIEFNMRVVWCAIRYDADFYEAHDLPTLLPVFLVAFLLDKPFAYHAHEMYAEMHPKVRFARLWKFVERTLAPLADVVVTPEENRSKILHLESGTKELPLTVRNCPPFIAPLESTRLRDRLREMGRNPKTIALYQGLFDDARCLRELIEASRHFDDGILLVLVGSGFGEWTTPERIISGAKNVEVLPRIPYEDLNSSTASADIGILLYRNDCRNNYYCAPNKVYEYMMMGLPVIANDYPGIAKLVRDNNVGLCVDASKPKEIADAVNRLAADLEVRRIMRANGLEVSRTKYHWEEEYKKLKYAYDRVIGHGNRKEEVLRGGSNCNAESEVDASITSCAASHRSDVVERIAE
jgi:glycosyltransferase involved in cell wall biosynthesis